MATVVDALIITLGLDPSGLKKGRSDSAAILAGMKADAQSAADEIARIRRQSTADTKAQDQEQIKALQEVQAARRKSIREMEANQKAEAASTKKQTEGLATLKGGLLEVLGLFATGGALAAFVTHTATSEAAVGRLAANLGVSTEALSTFQDMARRAGGSAQDGAADITTLANAWEGWVLNRTTGHDADFRAFPGFNMEMLKDPAAMMRMFAKGSERMPREEFAARLSRIGITSAGINETADGLKAYDDLYARAYRAARIMDVDAESGKRLNNVMIDLDDSIKRVGRDMLTSASPGVESTAVGLNQLADWSKNNEPVVAGAFAGLGVAATGLAIAAAAPLAPFALLLGSIAAVGAAIGWLYEKAGTPIGDAIARSAAGGADLGDLAAKAGPKPKGGGWGDLGVWLGLGNEQPTSAPASSGAAKDGSSSSPGSRAQIEAFFRAQGWNATAIRGIVGGIGAESRFDPNAVNPLSGAFGIGQWLGPRKKALFARYGSAPTLSQQLQFMQWELTNSEKVAGSQIANAGTDSGALAAYVTQFMRPGTGTGGDLRRGLAFQGDNSLITRAQAAASSTITTVNNAPVTNTTTFNGGITISGVTDAKEAARQLPQAIRQRGLAFQADSGLG